MSKFLAVLMPIVELLNRKNSDYGNSYYDLRDKYGDVAFRVRVADKLGRLDTLCQKPAQVNDESRLDTIRDMLGYCILELVYLEEQGEDING